MTKDKTNTATGIQQPVGNSQPAKASRCNRQASLIYGIGFLLLAVFCCWTYGDVFRQIAEEDFVCSDAEAMTFVRRLSMGYIFWGARYVLLVFKNQWIGGLLMAALLTLSAWLFDRLLPAGKAMLRGLGFLPVVGLLAWMVYRGYNLFLRCEISTFVIQVLVLFAVALVCGVVGCFIHRSKKNAVAEPSVKASRLNSIPVSALVALLAYCGLTWQAFVPGENVRISCKMQNLMIEEDWEGMTEAALTCKQPSRSVAALYIISLVQQNNLLDRVFDIPYNYPKIELDNIGGSDEGVNYIADCNLYAGLPNSGYHTSMENHVMFGPRLNNYKRMAICSILNDEKELAERYLHLISKVPFEQDWIDTYTPYVGHPELLKNNPTFARILDLYPREDKFEQNYRQPIFLGYNAGLLSGSDATLLTSVATCMYSKDLNNLLLRTSFLQQKMPTLPTTVQQSIAVASVNREGLLDKYPSCKSNRMLLSELQSFVTDARDYLDRMKQTDDTDAKNAIRQEMARDLRDAWLGTYYYYYYCGNIDQTVQKAQSHGVN